MTKNVNHIVLLRINNKVNIDIDPVLLTLFKKTFVWANEMGLKGKGVTPIDKYVNIDIDPVFLNSLKRAFVWANDMGLKGKGVTPFVIKKGSDEPLCHPKDAQHTIETSIFDPIKIEDEKHNKSRPSP